MFEFDHPGTLSRLHLDRKAGERGHNSRKTRDKHYRDNDSNQDGVDRINPRSGDDDLEEDDEDDDAKLLEYKFDYGFNPLIFLGEYLRRNNPAAVQTRKEKLITDLAYLRHRAAKCLGREAIAVELCELVNTRRSGVVHGPIAGDVSDCGAIVWAKVFRPGQEIKRVVGCPQYINSGMDTPACRPFLFQYSLSSTSQFICKLVQH